MIVQVPLIAFGIWLASERAGVHDTEVAVVLVAIVPLVFPKEYVSVCVKAEEARLIEIVPADPIVMFPAVTPEARGMLSSVMLALAVIVPSYVPLKVARIWNTAEIAKDLLPSLA